MKTINFFTDLFLVFVASDASAWITRNASETLTGTNLTIKKSEMGDDGLASIPKSRRKRYISQDDMIAILDYHNKVRANVFPPAANMEYMVSISKKKKKKKKKKKNMKHFTPHYQH